MELNLLHLRSGRCEGRRVARPKARLSSSSQKRVSAGPTLLEPFLLFEVLCVIEAHPHARDSFTPPLYWFDKDRSSSARGGLRQDLTAPDKLCCSLSSFLLYTSPPVPANIHSTWLDPPGLVLIPQTANRQTATSRRNEQMQETDARTAVGQAQRARAGLPGREAFPKSIAINRWRKVEPTAPTRRTWPS